jgi:hypothetical protein
MIWTSRHRREWAALVHEDEQERWDFQPAEARVYLRPLALMIAGDFRR